MAAADTREAIEFSVGLRRDGEPGIQRKINSQSIVHIVTTTSVQAYTVTYKMHICKLHYLLTLPPAE